MIILSYHPSALLSYNVVCISYVIYCTCTYLAKGLYETDSTPMVAYVNTHVQLEARRDVALSNRDKGPRVIIVGPVDHGKSTLSQILSAYAVRLDRTPLFIDLDIGQGSFCVPGCIYGIPLDKACLSVEVRYN